MNFADIDADIESCKFEIEVLFNFTHLAYFCSYGPISVLKENDSITLSMFTHFIYLFIYLLFFFIFIFIYLFHMRNK